MSTNYLFAGVAVADYDAALSWYQRFFGRAPDVIVTEHEAMWQVTETGWIYVVADSARAGKALVTLLVDDLDQHVAELQQRGLEPSAIETAPGLYRKAALTDPEGNRLSIGENLNTAPTQAGN